MHKFGSMNTKYTKSDRATATERSDRPAVFESVHREESLLRFHAHGSAFATIVLQGSYTEVCNVTPSACPAGTIVVHDADEEHANYFTNAGRCLNVELEQSSRRVLLDVPAGGRLRDAVDDLARAFYTRASARDLDASVDRFRKMLNASPSEPALTEPPWLEAVIERFEWAGPRPLRDAAALAGVHPTHFSREFHRKLGETPNDFRRRIRVRRASELLLSSCERIAAIALACGFNDQSHLTRAFGTSLGLSPAEYRRTFAR
jgi:AraC family transcriptional regulator